jgi:hypothetical protein
MGKTHPNDPKESAILIGKAHPNYPNGDLINGESGKI